MLIVIILLVGLIILAFVLPIRAAIRSGEALLQIERMREQLAKLHHRMELIQERLSSLERGTQVPVPESAPEPGVGKEAEPDSKEFLAAHRRLTESAGAPLSQEPPEPAGTPQTPGLGTPAEPPPIPARPVESIQQKAAVPGFKLPELNLEQFMGVKLFAWLGGLALFFGVVFFVKYAFEHDLIPASMRVAIGFITGGALLIAGVLVHRRERYAVLAQTFCASGTLVLYGVAYAAHAVYHFFSPFTALGVMSVITAAAFVLAVRLDAPVVAVLGIVGGFLAPVLCSTGVDNPPGLFGYIALLDIGLLALARVRKWFFLASLGAMGTILTQFAWFDQFFQRNTYYEGGATWTPVLVFSSFMLLFLIAAVRARQDEKGDPHPGGAAMAMCGSAMLLAFIFLGYPQITNRPGLLYSFVFLINAGVLAGIVINPKLGAGQIIAGLLTFAHLAVWTTEKLKPEALNSALAAYFVFGVLHSVFPVVWQRLKPGNAFALHGAFSPWFPPLTLVLMLLPVMSLPDASFVIWPAILLVDALAIVVAVTTSILLPVLVALLLTLGATFLWLLKAPPQITSLSPFLLLVGVFAAFFAAAGCWLAKRHPATLRRSTGPAATNDRVAAALPVMSAALPFALLIMATLRLPVTNPTPVFGLGLALALLLLGLARVSGFTQLSLTALGCLFALEFSWHNTRFDPLQPGTPLAWYIGINALFAVYPFALRNAFRQTVLPWATAALAAAWQFALVYLTVKAAFPSMSGKMGLVPAAFALPALASLFAVIRCVKSEGEARLGQLAWFGGVALLFITLIFPIQFHRQWITLGWALEGAALIWLFRRVPHEGLRLTGLALLGAAFARLAVNPAVLTYQPHSEVPVLNWYFYTYGIAAAAMFLGAWWLREPHRKLGDINARATLWAFGGILLFWLLNIEIADCFTPAGARFTTIDLTGIDLGRDMTYSIAWGLFALALLVTGFWAKARGARYAGIALMAVTLLKVFFHDLAALENIYRIAALIGVAIIALAASFLYQRFFERTESK